MFTTIWHPFSQANMAQR